MRPHSAVQKYRNSSPEANPDPEISRALFFGEPPAVATVRTLAYLIRGVSVALMGLAPEAWIALQQTESMQALLASVGELRATTAAMSEARDITAAAPTCLLATTHDALREYRRRLQFLAANLRFTDCGSRELLAEILNFDRWQAVHRSRCQECRGVR